LRGLAEAVLKRATFEKKLDDASKCLRDELAFILTAVDHGEHDGTLPGFAGTQQTISGTDSRSGDHRTWFDDGRRRAIKTKSKSYRFLGHQYHIAAVPHQRQANDVGHGCRLLYR